MGPRHARLMVGCLEEYLLSNFKGPSTERLKTWTVSLLTCKDSTCMFAFWGCLFMFSPLLQLTLRPLFFESPGAFPAFPLPEASVTSISAQLRYASQHRQSKGGTKRLFMRRMCFRWSHLGHTMIKQKWWGEGSRAKVERLNSIPSWGSSNMAGLMISNQRFVDVFAFWRWWLSSLPGYFTGVLPSYITCILVKGPTDPWRAICATGWWCEPF